EIGRDDYAGVNVRGKIVVLFGGAPTTLNSEVRAHFSGLAAKADVAGAHGAVGVIQLESAAKPGRGVPGFAQLKLGYARPRTTWATADGLGGSTPGS
ncbi:hypothetical protein ACTGWD_11630, partial [Streptococcus suis]